MKNQYVGDISDYYKFCLLEMISEVLKKKIMVAWMLTKNDDPNKTKKKDGQRITYLNVLPNTPNKYREFNPSLFDGLYSIIEDWKKNFTEDEDESKNARRVDRIQSIYEGKMTFYPDCLPGASYSDKYLPKEVKNRKDHKDAKNREDNKDVKYREDYFAELFNAVDDKVDLVFFDPDNGLEVSYVRGTQNSLKYVYWDDIELLLTEKKKDVLIYQYSWHPDRVEFLNKKLKKHGINKEVVSIFTWGISFLLITSSENKKKLVNAVDLSEQKHLEEMEPITIWKRKLPFEKETN